MNTACSVLGTVRKHGFDDKGYERRERLSAIGECPRCENPVELWESTVEWTKTRAGNWKHNAYDGCATGQCCGLLFADHWDGCSVFELNTQNAELSDQ